MRSLDPDYSSSSDESYQSSQVVSKRSVRHQSQPDLLDEDIEQKVKISVKRTESDVEKRKEKRLSDNKKEKRKSRMFTGRERSNTGSNTGEGSIFSLKNPMTMFRAKGSTRDISESNVEQF